MDKDFYRATPGKTLADTDTPERLRDIIRELEQSRGLRGFRIEVSTDLVGPRIIVTASSDESERELAERLWPHIVEVLNATYGRLMAALAAAHKESQP